MNICQHQDLSISIGLASKRGSESQRSKCSKSKAWKWSEPLENSLCGACEKTERMTAGKSNGEALGKKNLTASRLRRFRDLWVSEPCSPPVWAVHRAPSAQVEARIRAPQLGSSARDGSQLYSYILFNSSCSYSFNSSFLSFSPSAPSPGSRPGCGHEVRVWRTCHAASMVGWPQKSYTKLCTLSRLSFTLTQSKQWNWVAKLTSNVQTSLDPKKHREKWDYTKYWEKWEYTKYREKWEYTKSF